MEEDFEQIGALAAQLAPALDIDLEIEVQPNKRLRPVEPARSMVKTDKRAPRRGDFDFKGKPRAEVSGARITVWYEEEHGGRKMDVPYVGVVNSCDPREGEHATAFVFPVWPAFDESLPFVQSCSQISIHDGCLTPSSNASPFL